MPPQTFLCERGREWISLRADGELSELAGKMLDAHLARCRSCRDFGDRVEGVTEWLRTAEVEAPSGAIRISGRRRLRLGAVGMSAAAAAVAAVTVGAASLMTLRSSPSFESASGPLVVVAQPSSNADLRMMREMRAAGLRPVVPAPKRRRGPQSV